MIVDLRLDDEDEGELPTATMGAEVPLGMVGIVRVPRIARSLAAADEAIAAALALRAEANALGGGRDLDGELGGGRVEQDKLAPDEDACSSAAVAGRMDVNARILGRATDGCPAFTSSTNLGCFLASSIHIPVLVIDTGAPGYRPLAPSLGATVEAAGSICSPRPPAGIAKLARLPYTPSVGPPPGPCVILSNKTTFSSLSFCATARTVVFQREGSCVTKVRRDSEAAREAVSWVIGPPEGDVGELGLEGADTLVFMVMGACGETTR